MTTAAGDPGFTTDAASALLAVDRQVAGWCRVEAALAEASAAVGVVPVAAATAIRERCARGVGDPGQVLRDGWERGTPVLALLDRLRADLDDDDVAGWLHHGATTQDVIDTATMLTLREGLGLVRVDLAAATRSLAALARTHLDEATTAWTLLQPAVPTTHGRRIVGWLAPLAGHLRRLRDVAAALPVQLGGPAGTLAELGEDGPAVVATLADRLGLVAPPLPWHTDRTPVRRAVTALHETTRTVATVAGDLVLLAHRGVATMRAGASSAMPDKRNPIDAVRAIAAAEACSGAATVVLRGRPHELERAVGGWQAEWWAVPQVLHTAAAAAEALARAAASLSVTDVDRPAGEAVGTGASPAAGVADVLATVDDELRR